MKNLFIVALVFITFSVCEGQQRENKFPLRDTVQLVANHVIMNKAVWDGKKSLQIIDAQPESNSELKLVSIPNTDFHDGVIEVELAGRPMKQASEGARGFVGIAFRIANDYSKFECIYLRPTNGRVLDQVRRNHSVQYISYPDYPWHRLRKEFPEKYESYADIGPGEWIKVRIEVKGTNARLFVNGAKEPTLIITDLKHGADLRGKIGLWIGPGSEAYFRNLIIKSDEQVSP